ncbi:MAG: DM13 domain-containing protein [Acidobacteriota bacterium]
MTTGRASSLGRSIRRAHDAKVFLRHLARGLLLGLVAFSVGLLPSAAAEAQDVVHQGRWTEVGYKIDGSWSIVRDGGRLFVVLDGAFSTKKAPDLKIFLTPRPLAENTNRNATQGSFLVAPLASNRGAQRFELRADPADYRAIIVHCEKFSKLWGGADLN